MLPRYAHRQQIPYQQRGFAPLAVIQSQLAPGKLSKGAFHRTVERQHSQQELTVHPVSGNRFEVDHPLDAGMVARGCSPQMFSRRNEEDGG
jgi:hypothetical protein